MFFERTKDFLASGIGFLIGIIGLVGNLYWLWLAIGFKNFWMFFAALFPLTAFFTAPIGAWALIFGTPVWLTELATDDEYYSEDTITEEALRQFVEDYNLQLPKRLDSVSIMTNVSVSSGPTIAYSFIWEEGPFLEDFLNNPEIAEMGKASAIRAGCSDPDGTRMFLDDGVTIEYIFHKPDGTLVYEYKFDVSDCAE